MQHRILLTSVFLLAAIGGTAEATVPCITFVHGHKAGTQISTDRNYAAYAAPDSNASYWYNGSGNAISDATSGYRVAYSVVNYNTYQYYWDAASEVADNLNSACPASATGNWIISHSMGGRVLAYILGNSVSGDPYYNYGGHNYAGVRSKYSTWFSIGGAMDGTEAAAAVCGNASTVCNWMADIVSWFADTSCDLGTQSLQHSYAPQYENGSRISTFLIGGYKAITGSSGCLNGEDDGIVEYASSYFCNDHPSDSASVGYDHFCSSLEDVSAGTFDGCGDNPANKCQAANKQRTGYRNYDSGYENHDSNRHSDARTGKRRAVAEGYWGGTVSTTSVDYSWTGSSETEIGWFVANSYNNP